MKIAIAVASTDKEAQIEDRAARSAYYLIVDTENGQSGTLVNPAAQAERAAGQEAAAFLVSEGVNRVVAGDFGPKFRTALQHAGIACEVSTGKASDLVKQLLD
jgi:predicted Fe-Mo cluster-binding NifX family protein